MISIIVAADDNLLIGKKDSPTGLPWSNKEDLKHFKKTTLNSNILMGLTTYKAIGRPLPKRHTIVLSDVEFHDDRVEVRHSLDEILEEYQGEDKQLYICGGASIYRQCLPKADELLLSRIPGSHEGEAYFPDFTQYGYKLVEERDMETFKLQIYKRNK